MKSSLVAVLVLLASPALSATYPCPSDPGFCYRDVGNDGCFDSGVDEGPINAEIEASEDFPVVPAPGSIVCPPSVGTLTATDMSIRLATLPGSSILLYGARIDTSGTFGLISGGDALVGGRVFTGGAISSSVDANGDVVVENRYRVGSGSQTSNLLLSSTSGDVVVGPRAALSASDVSFIAPSGNVTLRNGVSVQAKNSAVVSIDAGGSIEMTRPRVKANALLLVGADISILEKGTLKAAVAALHAAPGDVVIERVSVVAGEKGAIAPLTMSGTNITIGVPQAGKTPRSKLTYRGDQDVVIAATGVVDVANVVLKSRTDVDVSTAAGTLEVTGSKLIGIGAAPTVTISAGPGSTCDLTGTVVKKATLVTSCDTVVGP